MSQDGGGGQMVKETGASEVVSPAWGLGGGGWDLTLSLFLRSYRAASRDLILGLFTWQLDLKSDYCN